jgi:hypothetical protein
MKEKTVPFLLLIGTENTGMQLDTIQLNDPEDLNSHHCENLKSSNYSYFSFSLTIIILECGI